MKPVQLTKTQRYWKRHVTAALQSGSTLQSYADQQGIKVQTLYDWKYRLNKMGALGHDDAAPVAFQKVQIAPADDSFCIISLPNGITIEWSAAASTASLGNMLSELYKLS
jgi:hypothetical protein